MKKVSVVVIAIFFGTLLTSIILILMFMTVRSASGAQKPGDRNQTEVVSSGWLEKEVKKRQPILNEWIEAAKFAAGNDKEARAVVVFLKTLYIAIPASCAKQPFWIGTPPQNRLGVLLFLREDSSNQAWVDEFENTALANFRYPLIFFRPYQSGKFTRGLIALQQAYLAMHCHEMGDKNSFYLFQVKCLEMLSRVISQKFPGYTEKVVGRQILLSENALWLQFNLKGLQMIYGKKAWRAERLFQKGLLTLHAVLEGVKRETYADNFKAMMVRLSILFEDYEEETDTGITMIQALTR